MMTFLVAFAPSLAWAGAWEPKTMREPFSAREVERPLMLPKGWLEFGVGVDYKLAGGFWGPSGYPRVFDGDAAFMYSTERLQVRYGLSPKVELDFLVPYHVARLTNPTLGTDTRGHGIGDPRFGATFELLSEEAPTTSVVFSAHMKAPAGNEAPGSYIAGPSTFSTFVFSTGTWAADVALGAKKQMGIFAVTGRGGFVYNFSGIAQYVVETNYNQMNGRIKPGAQSWIELGGLAQLGPLALEARPGLEVHGPTMLGVSSSGFLPDQSLLPVEDSEGWSADVDAVATLNLVRSFDVSVGANIPLRGEDLMFFPLEDIHPTRGVTWSGTIEFRY